MPPVRYSEYQELLHTKIKELHDSGMGYRKIAKWLNENGYETPRRKRFFSNHVYSILKRHKDRQERLERINKEYELEYDEWWIECVDYKQILFNMTSRRSKDMRERLIFF